MAARKGQPKAPGSGRAKGVPNKLTRAFREAMASVFSSLGGEQHLLTWAKENPGDFYRIQARMVPPGSPVSIGPLTGSLVDQSRVVVAKLGEGAISPEQAGSIMQVILAQARVVEIDDLERRVKSLEERKHA